MIVLQRARSFHLPSEHIRACLGHEAGSCNLYRSPPVIKISRHRATGKSASPLQVVMPSLLNRFSILGPMPSMIFKSLSLTDLPKAALAPPASKFISSMAASAPTSPIPLASEAAKPDANDAASVVPDGAELALFNESRHAARSASRRVFLSCKAFRSPEVSTPLAERLPMR